jgi:hypothetical protein
MVNCQAELCHNWTGDGCICAVMGTGPSLTCVICGRPISVSQIPMCDECRDNHL